MGSIPALLPSLSNENVLFRGAIVCNPNQMELSEELNATVNPASQASLCYLGLSSQTQWQPTRIAHPTLSDLLLPAAECHTLAPLTLFHWELCNVNYRKIPIFSLLMVIDFRSHVGDYSFLIFTSSELHLSTMSMLHCLLNPASH